MRAREVLGSLLSLLVWGCAGPEAMADPRPAVTVLHTSDIHSQVWPQRVRVTSLEARLGLGEAGALDEVGGLARLATLLDAERARAPGALWLDSGDALEGAEIFQRFAGSAEIQLLGALGLSAMAVGNHELSLSAEELGQRADEASYPLLAANLSALPTTALAGRFAASVSLTTDGVRVGVIGVANAHSPPHLDEPANPWQLEVATDAAGAVQAAIDRLASLADLVVVLSHLGLDEDRSLVQGTTGIDLVLGGHQHIVTEQPEWVDDCGATSLRRQGRCSARAVPIVHSGAYGKWLSRLDLKLSPGASGFEIEEVRLSRFAVNRNVPESPRLLEELERLLPPPEPPIGFAPARISRRPAVRGESPLGNLLTDAVRSAVAADVVLLNASGLRADVEAGPVLRSDLHQVFPFEEPWRAGLVTGAALKRGLSRAARKSAARECTSSLEQSGLEWRVRCADCGSGCDEVRFRHRLLDDRALVTVALPEYLAMRGADFEELSGLTQRVDIDVMKALSRYFFSQPHGGEDACVPGLLQASSLRCQSAFGPSGCPVSVNRARIICDALPRVEGRRDGRIQMVP